MQKIINIKKYNYDCCTNHFYFINDNAIICFYQSLNCDLIFSCFSFNKRNKVTFIVNEKEFKEVYDLIENMLKQINLKKDTLEYKQLFKKGYFSWQSDAPANEESWNKLEKFVYNYFNIIPINTAYKLEFINNLDNNRFNIEINTDRSRYATIRFDLWDFYKNLEIVCPQEEQITLNKFVKCLALKYKNN